VARRFLAAAEAMARDGWWWEAEAVGGSRATIKRQIVQEMLHHRLSRLLGRRSTTA
jgi:hypothetical protein